ncbi:unnamed protein product [Parajaminaea phylloscopi]
MNDSAEKQVSTPKDAPHAGAPEEGEVSPLGQQVGPWSVVALNLSGMIGTGIFSTPGSISKELGSVGASLCMWVVGAILSFAGLAVYNEYASYFPTRGGGEVVYLEKAYPRPRYLLPVTFAVQTVVLSFSSSNCVVFATYTFASTGHDAGEWQAKAVACAVMTLATLATIASTRWSLVICNAISYAKLVILVLIAVAGLAVLGERSHAGADFRRPTSLFTNTSTNGNAWASALIKILYSFAGWENANNVVNEIPRPIQTLKVWAPITLAAVSVLYFLAAVAYFAAVPLQEIQDSNTLTAALFFERVFGAHAGARTLPALVALSTFGNILAVIIGQVRVLREIGRQGVLPWPEAWASTHPFGTPLLPAAVKWALTVVMIVCVPFGDSFNFFADLASYPAALFTVLLAVGLFAVRRRCETERTVVFRAWVVAPVLFALQGAFLLVAPWIPPAGGAHAGDVSFWYATYCAVGVGLLCLCVLYWGVAFVLLPWWCGFEWVGEVVETQGGSRATRLVRAR